MLITIGCCFLLTVCYVVLMLRYRKGWGAQTYFSVDEGYVPATTISVIIPARNEAENIGKCIDSILAQKYPSDLFEIIVIDDHSDDDTFSVVQGYNNSNVRCLRLAEHIPSGARVNAYKKVAIALGVSQSKGALIATTDADCEVPERWLQHIAGIYEQQGPVMIVAPVIYMVQKRTVELFQLIDFMSMQGITAAAHALKMGNMCNGANLVFQKSAFEAVDGYEGIKHLASGDDYLLMMKMITQYPGRIAYLKSEHAIVKTAPQPDWQSFLNQRIRWASKSGKYDDARLTSILVFVYVFNLMLLALGIMSLFNLAFLPVLLVTILIKTAAEYYYLKPVARFFNKEWVLVYFPFLQPLHIIYIVSAGFMGLIGGYKWKGRKVR